MAITKIPNGLFTLVQKHGLILDSIVYDKALSHAFNTVYEFRMYQPKEYQEMYLPIGQRYPRYLGVPETRVNFRGTVEQFKDWLNNYPKQKKIKKVTYR